MGCRDGWGGCVGVGNDGPLNGRLVQSPVLKMMVPKQSAGAIIGKAAANIKACGETVLLAKGRI